MSNATSQANIPPGIARTLARAWAAGRGEKMQGPVHYSKKLDSVADQHAARAE